MINVRHGLLYLGRANKVCINDLSMLISKALRSEFLFFIKFPPSTRPLRKLPFKRLRPFLSETPEYIV